MGRAADKLDLAILLVFGLEREDYYYFSARHVSSVDMIGGRGSLNPNSSFFCDRREFQLDKKSCYQGDWIDCYNIAVPFCCINMPFALLLGFCVPSISNLFRGR